MYEIKKIKKVKVSEAVFEQMKQNILSKNFPPDSKLPSENELVDMFGVSRASVRIAIQKLVTLGLVETKNGEGSYVKEVNSGTLMTSLFNLISLESSQILEILQFRQAIEQLSCQLAASNATPAQIEELGHIVAEMQAAVDADDPQTYSVADMKFHGIIAEMSQNTLIISVLQVIQDYIFSHLVEMNNNIGLEFGFGFHVGIYEAIRQGDPDTAVKLIIQSIEQSIQEVASWDTTSQT